MAQELEQLLVSVFQLAEAQFGIPAAQIQEVVHVGTLTPVHHAPPCVAGIRNLRGRIVTVIDLRYKLGLDAAKVLPESRILIVNSDDELVGLLVEAVKDTIFLHPNDMSEAPPQVHGIDSTAVRGIYQTDGHLLALLDHDAILKSTRTGSQQ